MKKGLFLLLAIMTLGIVRVSADAVAPILDDKVVLVTLNDGVGLAKASEIYNIIIDTDNVMKTNYSITEKESTIVIFGENEAALNKIKENVEKIDGVKQVIVTYKTNNDDKCPACEDTKCETTKSDVLSEKDIKSLKTTTYLIYITLGILIILMIIIIILMITKYKNKSKKDA